jgi:hypothetical protein
MEGLRAADEVLESRSVEFQLIEERYVYVAESWGIDSRHDVL